MDDLNQEEKETKFRNLREFLEKQQVNDDKIGEIQKLYFSKDAASRKLLLSVLGPMLIPNMSTGQILTLMGIDFIGYSLLGNFLNDQRIQKLNGILGSLKIRQMNQRVRYDNERKAVQKQLLNVQDKIMNLMNDIQARSQDLEIWAESKRPV